MLLQNITILSQNVGISLGGATQNELTSSALKAGNLYTLFSSEASIPKVQSFPIGYSLKYAIIPAMSTGGIASINAINGAASITISNLAGGVYAVSSLSGTGTITTLDISALGHLTSLITGASVMIADIIGAVYIISSISGTATVTSAISASGFIASDVLADSSIAAYLAGGFNLSSDINGLSTATADITALATLVAALTGTSSISALLAGALLAVAALTGSSTLNADIIGLFLLGANLSGTSSFTAAVLSALAHISAELIGDSSVVDAILAGGRYIEADITTTSALSGSITALGQLSADIILGSTEELTADSITAAVWSAVAAAYNIPGTMGEKLNDAGTAGDPWNTSIPDTYPLGTAGHKLGNLDTSTLALESTLDDIKGAGWSAESLKAVFDKVLELYNLAGLDPGIPLEVTQTNRIAGSIIQDIDVDAVTKKTTVTRI